MTMKTKKYYVVLSKVFTVRVDFDFATQKGVQFLLIASKATLGRLPEKRKSGFLSIVVSDFSLADLTKQISDFIVKNDIAIEDLGIITNDEHLLAMAGRLREQFNLEGPKEKDTEPFLNKKVMKEMVERQGIRVPKYIIFSPSEYQKDKTAYIEHIRTVIGSDHIFAKPIDSVGSLGVADLKTPEDLTQWCEAHATETNYELDEFIEGTLYHVDSLIQNGKAQHAQPYLYTYPNADYRLGKPYGSRIVTPEEPEHARLVKFNQRVLEALSPLPEGATHHEIFRKLDGELVFVEIAARPPGGLAPEMFEKYIGFNFEEGHFRLQMGLPLPTAIPIEERRTLGAFCWYPQVEGAVATLKEKAPTRSDSVLRHFLTPGRIMHQAKSLEGPMAIVSFYTTDKAELLSDFEVIRNFYPVEVEPTNEAEKEEAPESQGNTLRMYKKISPKPEQLFSFYSIIPKYIMGQLSMLIVSAGNMNVLNEMSVATFASSFASPNGFINTYLSLESQYFFPLLREIGSDNFELLLRQHEELREKFSAISRELGSLKDINPHVFYLSICNLSNLFSTYLLNKEFKVIPELKQNFTEKRLRDLDVFIGKEMFRRTDPQNFGTIFNAFNARVQDDLKHLLPDNIMFTPTGSYSIT